MAEASERVMVTSLPAGMTDKALKDVFAAYGTIKEIKNLAGSVGSKSYILVFASVDEAKWVVENLDGNMPEGITEPIGVKYAPKPGGAAKGGDSWKGGGWKGGDNRSTPYGGKGGGGWCTGGGPGEWGAGPPGGKGGSIQGLKRAMQYSLPGGGGKGHAAEECQVYIKGLPADTTNADLYDIFSPFGAIPPRGVKAMMTEDGNCRGVGWVDFIDAECAKTAAQTLNGTMMVDGTTLRCHVKAEMKTWGGKKNE